ncbi:hypothetical protein B0H15DRAFT_942680 [Mycena belliarum]|uniref:Uncharacterized protein n=1 Tax=Mycena belliarum TaxID=1033014 RepID=A0AAD6UH01_9AGAR|nr:hypothetical protein B0H15DRAFT_942680 [Mycena belliae]
MSSDKVNGTDTAQANGSDPKSPQITASIEADIAELSELLSKDTLDDAGEASVAELLARLESADGVAKGVESKLDSLLGNLDTLLASLEKDGASDHPSSEAPASQSTDKET